MALPIPNSNIGYPIKSHNSSLLLSHDGMVSSDAIVRSHLIQSDLLMFILLRG